MTTIPVTVTVQDKNNQLATSVGGSVTPGGATGSFTSGETAIGTLDDNGNANIILAQPVTLTQAGTIASLSIYITTLSGQVRLAIYSDVSGKPGSKLAETAAFTPIAAWNTKPTLTTPVFQAGNYWLSFLPQNNSLGFRKFRTTGTSWFNSFTFATAPATFPNTGATSTISHWSMYATFSGGTVATVWVNSVAPGGTVPPNPPPTGSCPMGSAFADGCPAAPAGTPAYPNQLNGYLTRTPWNVADVDYHVGIDRSVYPTNASLKDPFANFGAGTIAAALLAAPFNATIGDDPWEIKIHGSAPGTIDGYDWSLHGGLCLTISSGTGITVQNNNFEVGTNGNQTFNEFGGVNTIVQKNEFNGHGLENHFVGRGLIQHNGTGQVLIQYNRIQNAFSEHIVYGQNTPGDTTTDLVIQFNSMKDCGFGAPTAHGDFIQLTNANNCQLRSFTWNFNLIIQTGPKGSPSEGTQGVSISSANGGAQGPTGTSTCNNNTYIALGSASVNQFHLFDTFNMGFIAGAVNGTGVQSNNYMDPTGGNVGGSFGYWFIGGPNGPPSDGSFSGTVSGTGNINMLTGATVTPTNANRGFP